ncbi:MAG: STN domain-containing protein [Sediminicola sp.]
MNKLNRFKSTCTVHLRFDVKMKLTTFLLMVSLLQINANTYSQNTRITLEMDQVKLEDVLDKIETLSEFKFLVDTKKIDVDRIVSVQGKRERISSILEKLFSGTGVSYEVFNKQIILKKIDLVVPIKSTSSVETVILQPK